MNRILIDEYEKKLIDIKGIIEITQEDSHIHLDGNNQILGIIMNEFHKLTFDIESDANLKMNVFWDTPPKELDLSINIQNNAKFQSHFNIAVKNDFHFNYQNNLLGNDSISKTTIHVVTEENATCKIRTTGYIKKDTTNNEFLEELKGITSNISSITFLPDLIVDSDSVVANHNASIKYIDEEELFYLKSKGLDEKKAKKLIKTGFLRQGGE